MNDVSFLRNRYFKSRTFSGMRFQIQFAPDIAHALLDNCWAPSRVHQFAVSKSTVETESGAVIGNRKLPETIFPAKTNQHMLSGGVLPNVYETFLYDANQFTASMRT
jgi:hypothetical protein